ncbi:ABC transporter [Actinoplanes italicus]|uniref:ABC transporter domain-containing protein n=1 Tax=Actinoplanes italicus TaxID=113567 RepID=A0A2T0JKP7_9ACTN|nr:ATP-binding cassette domain-containing protein [Actinoplanes italicus]PRX08188.1 amino acid/amide ABC transporter membrane protein 1 (HAAT family) /amino acid/amide ABC transporter membrane protein 2 (HAAT family) /amino acid/amide ABC transporter ATP-binding protein 1 (HAAT family) [Actinoplanes italicus]GIE36945.1 ABC transporter [Actinoplanes italicus]
MSVAGFDLGFDRLTVGLFTGLTYGLLAIGLVLVFRSSRFVNFAHGAVGVFGAAVLARFATGMPYWLAFPIAIVVAGGLAALIEIVVVRRLYRRPRVIGMIATLGLSQFILVLALLVSRDSFSGTTYPKPPGLPAFSIGTTAVGSSLTAMLLLTPVLLAALAFFLRRTRYGIGIRAAADHPDAATVNGVPAPRMATLAWAVAGGIAAFSAILLTPTQGVQSIESLGPQLLLRGLAGAVIARMTSLPIAFGASIGVGVLEQILLSREGSGFVDVVLGLAILVSLLRQRQGGRRDDQAAPWPRQERRAPSAAARAGLALLAASGVGLAYVVSNATASILTTICGFTLVALSVILVTGIAGELSLGQFGFAGIGAAVAVQVAVLTGNMFLGTVAGCAAGALSAVLVGIPALRLRGVALGVTTLAFALATSGWLLRRPWLLGDGLDVAYPVWHDYTVSVATDYYLFALLLLGLGWWVTARLGGGGFGRLLLALRDNEEAGRALTVKAPLRKLQAYAVGGALAGLGGVVIGFGQSQLSINNFPAAASIDVVAIAVVGGLARTGGALLGSVLIVGVPLLYPLGIPGQAVLTFGWLLVVVLLPDGLGGFVAGAVPRLWRRLTGRLRAPQTAGSQPASPAAVDPVSAPRLWNIAHLPAEPLPPGETFGPLLEVTGIRRSFGGVRAVQDATFTVTEGEIVGIIGPNGAGKTTLFEILAGFTGSDGGVVHYRGRNVTSWTPEARARSGLVRSFQDARLFPAMTVRENVMVAAENIAPVRLALDVIGDERSETVKAEHANAALRAMGLDWLADRPVGELSTGTRRVVELCCLLTLRPRLLLLDEPSSGLTQADGKALGDLILRVRAELGTTILVIEHDLPLLSRVADRLIAMDAGTVIAQGPPDEVRNHPAVVLSYLGTDEAAVARSGEPAG